MRIIEQPDLFSRAITERDSGMAQAIDHADAVHPAWRDLAYDYLLAYAYVHQRFISEQVSYASKEDGFPQPPTDKAWGSVYRRAIKAGVIVQDGTGRSTRRHASICPRWASLIYRGGA